MNLTGFKKKSAADIADLYTTVNSRENTIPLLLEDAKCAKSGTEQYFQKMKSYYDGTHITQCQTGAFLSDMELPWKPATVPDGYMHVESQIDADVPEFEFTGREPDDEDKARVRQQVVKFICDNADLQTKNAVNERRLNLYGTAVWKLGIGDGENGAEIIIDNPSPETVFPDPNASSVDDCEYIGFVYDMSKIKAERIFAHDLDRLGTTIDEIASHGNGKTDVTDSVEITEWWYRQTVDGEGECEYALDGGTVTRLCPYKAGDIALSILICGTEVRNVPKFWDRTNCQKFPFVIYNKTPRDGSIWGKSELEAIIPLIDAADRQLAFAQLNTAFSANDIVVYEENAFSTDSYPQNSPGAAWRLRPGMIDKVKRLGGLVGDSTAHYEIVENYRTLMREALGNYDFLQGNSATQVTTATGLALLSDRASKRMNAKNICKKAGFERLYRLIDYLALEIYDSGDIELITGGKGKQFGFGDGGYLPLIDVIVNIGDGVANSRSFTLSALNDLMNMDVTEDNYPIVRAYISSLGIPEHASLCAHLDEKFDKGENEE